MIAVTGANGALGRLVIENLLTKVEAREIVALVRNPKDAEELIQTGIQVRKADYNEPQTLVSALDGVNRLLLISSNAIGSRVPQHEAVIDVAKSAAVQVLVYTSVLKADSNPMILAQEHAPTEKLIHESGLQYVILRNGWYTENYTQNLPGILQAGGVFGAAKEGKFYTAARKDYAEAAVEVLVNPEVHLGKTYELAGDNGFTLTEFAKAISEATGKQIPYTNMSGEDLSKLLQEVGLPAGFAEALADSEVFAAKGWLVETSKTLSKLIGRGTTPLADSIQEAL